jgi:acyl carrier protein
VVGELSKLGIEIRRKKLSAEKRLLLEGRLRGTTPTQDKRKIQRRSQRDFARLSLLGPRTPTEEVLAGIWAEVLKLDRVGIHDNFFELGGHSLLTMRSIARIRETFKLDLRLRTPFEMPSLGELADLLDTIRWAVGPTLSTAEKGETVGVI